MHCGFAFAFDKYIPKKYNRLTKIKRGEQIDLISEQPYC